jgi:alkanesulfonate monooxygenase SsuD/methylene tetrahydromethanopterin reductase-like flavin-dependent oxidoreductase (luciferase family)
VEIGVGLPATVPGATGEAIVEWARRADEGPFASVGCLDRLLYDNYDPLIALSAAAAVTQRVRLVTSILIAPVRELASLAKQLISLHALSGGRLVAGLAVGARRDDHQLSDFRAARRGDRLTDMVGRMRDLWEERAVSPAAAPKTAPTILLGGTSGPALARMARSGDGWVHSGGPPRAFARAAEQAMAAWQDHGRPGAPQRWGMAYFALGDAADEGRRYLLDYYAFTGVFAGRIADGLLATALDVRELVDGYADAGCDHLILFPAVADVAQLDALAAVVAR